jgi:replicative DNA helicase
MLLSAEAITSVQEIIKAEHFYRPANGQIFAAITKLVAEGEPVDPVTLAKALPRVDATHLHECMQVVPTPVNAATYARIVYDRWRQRQLVMIGQRISQLGFCEATTSDEVDSLLAQADGLVRELGEPSGRGLIWDDLIKKWVDWQDVEGDVTHTPWWELNRWFPGGGFHAGQLVMVGGRPGNGKSNAGLNIALNAAEHGQKTLIFSVEMDDVEVCSRLLAAGGWARFSQILAKKMDEDTKGRVDDYIEKSKGMPLEVIDQPYINVEQVIAHCRARRPEVVFIDYAQLIDPSNRRLPREQQVAHITRSLKVAAKALKMVVIVASQLKRIEGRLPTIEDLRESGAAEQDADVVILLHRPENSPKVKVIVGKNRNGPTGQVDLSFRGNVARVGDGAEH